MIGERFGRLLVLGVESKVIKKLGLLKWQAVFVIVELSGLLGVITKYGYTKSCGCLSKETASERATTHGNSSHPLFRVWYDMNRRCYDSKRKDFKHYGGREYWYVIGGSTHVPAELYRGFDNFLEDMFFRIFYRLRTRQG